MGQYHVIVNETKKQFLHPHKLGDGLKLLEFGCSRDGTMTALALLLSVHNGRGGGDFSGKDPRELVGSWAGDSIAIVGDYGDSEGDRFSGLYEAAMSDGSEWENISDFMRAAMESDAIDVGRSW